MRSAAMQSLTNDIERAYPGVTIWGKGDRAHQEHPSDHNEDDTSGSKPAQSDPDNIPEHRAIDVKVDGVAFTDADARTVINQVLATPDDLSRLNYINYKNSQWSHSHVDENGNWIELDNSDDPHPTHIHFSGKASKDADGAPWLTGGNDMLDFCNQNDPVGTGKVMVLQANINTVLAYMNLGPLLTVDDDYGAKTAAALLKIGCGNTDNGGSIYWVGEHLALHNKLREIKARQVLAEHIANASHGGDLPDAVQLIIPSYTVPAQTVMVPIQEGN